MRKPFSGIRSCLCPLHMEFGSKFNVYRAEEWSTTVNKNRRNAQDVLVFQEPGRQLARMLTGHRTWITAFTTEGFSRQSYVTNGRITARALMEISASSHTGSRSTAR